MSRKRKVYSAAFKSKLVLEVLKNEEPLSAIASAHNIYTEELTELEKDLSGQR